MEKASYLTSMQQSWNTCQGCLLCNERQSVVFGYGNPYSQILIVGEAPGEQEDLQGLPFVGAAGQLLDQYLATASIDPRLMELTADDKFPPKELREILKDTTFYTNVVSCRPPENRDPTIKEVVACRARLIELIYTVDPVLVIGVGRIASEALLRRKISITQVRGELFDITIPGRLIDVSYPMLAVLHTSYLLRVNDFKQKGGMSDKTFYDLLLAGHLVDWFNWLHYKQPLSKDRIERKMR